jgi:hypothetical protein
MPPIPTDNLDLVERVAVAQARQKREQYLQTLDALLASFGIAGEAASLDEIRAMFVRYEKPGMPTLSSEIEAMRKERCSTSIFHDAQHVTSGSSPVAQCFFILYVAL